MQVSILREDGIAVKRLQSQQASVHMRKDGLHEQSPVVKDRLSAVFPIYMKKRVWLFHPDSRSQLKLPITILLRSSFEELRQARLQEAQAREKEHLTRQLYSFRVIEQGEDQ